LLDAFLLASANLFQVGPLAALITGSLIGVATGALPGASLPSLIVLISIAWGMDPLIAIPLAVGMQATVHTSDTLPSVVLAIPGTQSSQATIMDGYPLARQGRAGEALAAGYTSSCVGGFVAALAIAAMLPIAKPLIQGFGSPELLVIAVLGLMMVALLSTGSFVKGLLAGTIGLALATVGLDLLTGEARFTGGVPYFLKGIGLIQVVVGVFAIPELIGLMVSNRSVAKVDIDKLSASMKAGRTLGILAVAHNKFLVFRSSLLGTVAGLLPGIGLSTIDWLVYVHAKLTERGAHQTFGTGDIRGVIAPESANNATAAAHFVPAMVLGLPISFSTALIIGLMMVLGLNPGPRMMENHLDLIYLVVLCLILSNALGTLVMLYVSPFVARVTFVRPSLLVPVLLAVLVLAAFQVSSSFWDLILLFVCAVLGWHMKRYAWPRPPLIIGLILGPLVEEYYVQSTRAFGLDGIFARPVVWIIIAFALVIGVIGWRFTRQGRQVEATAAAPPPSAEYPVQP
jgi:TctA family transporter